MTNPLCPQTGVPEPLSDLDRGCIESMKHNAQRMREECRRQRARAEAAEAKLGKVWALVANGCFSNPDEEQLLTDIRDDIEREW